jgi:hypothetical protein
VKSKEVLERNYLSEYRKIWENDVDVEWVKCNRKAKERREEEYEADTGKALICLIHEDKKKREKECSQLIK